jgi:hypothetical protein
MFDSFMQPFSAAALVAMAGMICHFVVCNVRQGEAGCLAYDRQFAGVFRDVKAAPAIRSAICLGNRPHFWPLAVRSGFPTWARGRS